MPKCKTINYRFAYDFPIKMAIWQDQLMEMMGMIPLRSSIKYLDQPLRLNDLGKNESVPIIKLAQKRRETHLINDNYTDRV